MKDNATTALARLVTELGIPISQTAIEKELEIHPDYDSFLAFSEVLNRWQIPNAAYGLPFDQLTDVPMPFIAYMTEKRFAVVSQMDENRIVLSNEQWNNKAFSVEEFKKMYAGFVFLAEAAEVPGELNYKKSRRKEILNSLRMPVFLTGLGAILLYALFAHSSYFNTFNFSILLITLFKSAGVAVTVLLLQQSIDANNPLIQKLCGDDSKSCNAILSSKQAKVTDELSWSEVGFFYFAGTWLALLFNSDNASVMKILAVLNLISLPYTVYSIYYQWRVAKQWCVFCCTVQALLWLEFFAFLPYLTQNQALPNLNEWAYFMASMAAPVLLWIFVKPLLLQTQQIKSLKRQVRGFKYNKEMFDKMLSGEIKYALPHEENSLTIGNLEAEHTITMVANPYCQPCAKAHNALQWLDNRDDIKLQIVFLTSTNENDKKAQVASHLLSLQSKGGSSVKKAMHDWYDQKQKNYDAWVDKYPAEKSATAINQLQKQQEWCKMTEITGTPTLFINGRRLPKFYQPEDLKYFI